MGETMANILGRPVTWAMAAVFAGAQMAALSLAPPAAHADAFAKGAFVEGGVGGGFSSFDDLEFQNPVGEAFTTNATNGSKIVLTDKEESDESISAKFGAGYRFGNALLRASYSYLGDQTASGFANFASGNFRQDLEVQAHSALIEAAYSQPVSGKIFVEGSVGVGFAFLDAEGKQGENLNDDNFFPDETNVNFAVNAGAGVGYRLTDKASLLLFGDYTYLGEASTDITDGTESTTGGGINAGEQLSADIAVWRVMLSLRYQF